MGQEAWWRPRGWYLAGNGPWTPGPCLKYLGGGAKDLHPVQELPLHERMDHMLKKLPFLKKEDSKESHPQITNNDPWQWNSHFSGSHPSTSSATQRTTQVLPLLVKGSPAPVDMSKKVQPPALVLPELVRRTPLRASQGEMKPGLKEPPPLPRRPERERAPGRKSSQDTILPSYPELSDESFKNLWESRKPLKGRPVKEILDLMDEREILETILDHLRPFQIPSDHKLPRRKTSALPPIDQKQSTSQVLSKDKISLYKYYGVKLRNSTQKDLVTEQLQSLLSFSLQEETDREGISESIRMASFCHLPEILVALEEAGQFRQTKGPFAVEAPIEDSQTLSERWIRTTLILCYGQAVLGAQVEDMMPFLDNIVSEILYQYSSMKKDEGLKKAFMRSIIMITKAVANSRRQDLDLPQKQELVTNIVEVIEDEPARPLSIENLHQAIITITCMSRMKPPLNSEMRSKVVRKSIQKVFSLPAYLVTKLNVNGPGQPAQTQDFYDQMVTTCNTMLTALLSEAPNLDSLQDVLTHINPWIESPKRHERERAIKSIRHLLKFVSENVNFDPTGDFSLLGQLVALLGLHVGDTSKEVGQTSAEAAYHLHHLIMSKMAKEMDEKPRNKKGKVVTWLREDFSFSGPTIFYNNVSKMATAFGEHLSPSQINDLILKALAALTHLDKNISHTAGLLLNSFLEECGMDMEELPMILKEIYRRLPKILDPATKQQTLKAVCHLASKRVNKVVDILLECSVACDGSARELWRALAADPYANLKIMKPLLKRLDDHDPSTEAIGRGTSKSIMPIAATNALSFLLSLPEAATIVQHKFSSLLLALVTHIYFLLGAGKSGSEQTYHLGNAVKAVKHLILRTGYQEEFKDLDMVQCWAMLMSPESVFEGIFHLVRILFNYSKHELKVMLRQAETYVRHPDLRHKTIGMVFFSELLFHPEICQFFVIQDILQVLKEWMTQPYPLIQTFSVRGLGNLIQHPFEKNILEPLLMPVLNCACHEQKTVAKEAIRTLHFLLRNLDIKTHAVKAVNLIPLLLKHFHDDDIELRNTSITIFGMLLKGLKELRNSNMAENILNSLIPLLIQLSNDRTKEVSRKTLDSCVSFMNWGGFPSNLFDYEMYTSLHSMYSNICYVVMNKCKQNLPAMLDQMLGFLRSRNSSHREAAALLIGCCAQYMQPEVMTSKQMKEVFLGLQDLQGDSEASVAQAAADSMQEIFRQCGHLIKPGLVSSQLLSKGIRRISETKQ
ncbi:maestro heat-like repeat family member 5 isoform X2 [Pantherophis guttatus]|uniref:Maestro heat-like repeat family member 5 isoform X2 n=1 Tax=Pantherophis guttatus TaxID=94885 RepID=A0ABM3YR50_PANGU|nr:maestro heat-like repeat family member 5 isoform X2 [Pantherophis guttatus]XP_060538606.1 maestro heat-like repeat family member 5 isoform X2 [Pantherophis guttatus]